MPPDLFTRSAHHSVPRNPAVPTGAAMPARMARMPILTGSEGTPFFACARATVGNDGAASTAGEAPAPLMNARRRMFMHSSVEAGVDDPVQERVDDRGGPLIRQGEPATVVNGGMVECGPCDGRDCPRRPL